MTLRLFNQRSQNSSINSVGGVAVPLRPQSIDSRADLDGIASTAWHLIMEPDEVTNELELFFRRQLHKEQELLPC